MKTVQFDVTGMTCSACSAHVEKAVNALQGVEKAEVSLLLNQMKVTYDETRLRDEDVTAAVEKAGYGAAPKQEGAAKAPREDDPLKAAQKQTGVMKTRLIVSFVFLIPLFYLSMGHMMGWPTPGIFHGTENALTLAFTQLLLTLPIVYVNRKYFQVGFKTLFRGSPNMDSLIALGSSAALLYGVFAIYQIGYGLGHGDAARVHSYMMDLYFESAGMILALITLGKFLEARSKGKTGDAISRLLDLSPPTALVLRGGEEQEIPAEELVVGDVMLIKPGMSVPADGEVIEGVSSVDESAITGESIPVEKGPGSALTAATINKSGFLQARATRVGGDTTLSQIIRLVEEAGASKAPIAKLADKISGIFVPVVMVIAVLAAVVWLLLGESFTFALSIGISVLVISCPCALGLATPVAIMVGTGKGAEQGILFKSAEALEHAHSIDTVVLDKTGTITEGKPQVTDILVADGVREEEFLCMAASLEKSSEHPLADAVVQYAQQQNAPTVPVKEFEALFGRGATAVIGSHRYYAGNSALMQEKGVDIAEA
ncbi:MAG: heavy metal translocating P-type ATPase, partial [Oscillospiraceae bacterium]|nr:heavy metal translocating P-type ATPase [Oscillospiraceae bacterium]